MKRFAAFAISVPLLLAQAGREPSLTVLAVRHSTVSGVTHVAAEVSGEFQFRTDRLHNPERVYFDIPNSRPRIASRATYSETVEDRLVKRIRVAQPAPGVTRVVLDLADGVEVSSSQLANPHRLVIELRPAAAPAPSHPDAPQPAANSKTGAALPPENPKTAAPEPPVAPPESGKAAKRTSSGGSSLVRALGLKLSRVVIDPGHGGHDQGTEGPHGLLEKELVLDVSLRLGGIIEDLLGAQVIYTRSDDTYIPLERRTALANEKKADLFLSIHANSSPTPHIAGVETFFLNISGPQDAMDVASRENASSQKSIFELTDLIQKIARHDKAEESKEFAHRIQAELYAFSARNIPGSKNRGVKSAPFVVLIGANMPSILAEIGFLSNPKEEALLKKPDYRQKLADALFRGVSRYADSLSHFQVASTPVRSAARR